MFGRCTASQMTAASAASFLPHLPLMRYGVTSLGAISRTVWPWALELPRPVVRAGARLDADGARRQRGHQSVELGARNLGLAQLHGTCGIDAVHSEHVLGQIDTNGQNGHGLPLSSELMRVRTSHRGTELPIAAIPQRARDGEVPFIRYGPRTRAATNSWHAYPKASDISSPPCLLRLLPAGAVAGWGLHPLESAAFSRRTPFAAGRQPRFLAR